MDISDIVRHPIVSKIIDAMKNTKLISSSKKLKLEITIQNQKLWKDLDNIFCILVLDYPKLLIKTNLKIASILLIDDLYMKKINKMEEIEKATNVLSFPVNKQIKEEDYFYW